MIVKICWLTLKKLYFEIYLVKIFVKTFRESHFHVIVWVEVLSRYSLGITHQQLVVMRTNKPRELINRAEIFHWWKSLLRYFSILKACFLIHLFNSMFAWYQLHIVIRNHFIRELVECSIVTLRQCVLKNSTCGLVH